MDKENVKKQNDIKEENNDLKGNYVLEEKHTKEKEIK